MKFASNLVAVDPMIIVGVIIGVLALIGIITAIIVVVRKKGSKKQDALTIANSLRPAANPDLPQSEPQAEPVAEQPVEEDDYDRITAELEQAEKELETLSEELDKTDEEVLAEGEPAPVQEEDEEVVEEAPAEEVVEEVAEAPVEEAPVEEAPVEEAPAEEAPVEEAPVLQKPVKESTGGKISIRVRYNRSLTAKLIQSDDVVKNYYSEIKNELLRYKKVRSRISWRHETFRLGRRLLVRLTMRGKTLSLYLALNPADYAGTKYKVQDVSHVARNASVPALYKIKNDRRCRYAKQLIADLMAANGVPAGEELHEDYAAQYPYEEIEPLIDRELVKLVPWKEFSFGSEVGVINVAEEDVTEEIAAAQVPEGEPVEEVAEVEEVEEPEVEEAPAEEVAEEVTEVAEVAEEEPVEEEPAEERHAPAPEGKILIRVRYNRSYTARLIQSEETTKNYYAEIKNELLRYKKVKSRISWRYETFRLGRKLIAKLAIRGKTLNVYLALDPAEFADTKYKIDDVSHVASNADVPTRYKIKNDRRCRYAKELIARLMEANGIPAGEELHEDYASQYPYEEIEPLIDRNLVKLVPWKEFVAGSEVGVIAVAEEDITDEIAAAAEQPAEEVAEVAEEPAEEEAVEEPAPEVVEEPVPEIPEQPAPDDDDEEEESVANFFNEEEPAEEPEEISPEVDMSINVVEADEILDDSFVEAFVRQGSKLSDKSKKAIVNIDTLGKYFEAGETVTVDEIRKRIPSVGKNVTYIKVLARGVLDKALTVEADDFTPQAIKMIVLTGGTVIRTKTDRN